MKVIYQGREREASEIKSGDAAYYQIPGVGEVPAAWVQVVEAAEELEESEEPDKPKPRRARNAATD